MGQNKTNKTNQHSLSDQGRRFIQTARELGCDESEESFNDKLRKVVRRKVEEAVSAFDLTKRYPEDKNAK